MWEARVAPGRLADAEHWVTEVLLRSALDAGAAGAEAFRADGEDPRVVAITRWASEPAWTEPAPDDALVVRAHAWRFEELGPAQ
jgi:hypothetical protein